MFSVALSALIYSVILAELNIQADLSCYVTQLQTFVIDSEIECSFWTAQMFYEQEYECVKRSTTSHTLERDKRTCDFNFDETQYRTKNFFPAGGLPPDVNTSQISWSCKLNSLEQICNGYSECLTDECWCENSDRVHSDVFYCADGAGCITWEKLCDNIQHCRDGSDECSCPDHFVFFSPEIEQWACFSEAHYCENLASQSTSFLLIDAPDVFKKVNCSDTEKIQDKTFYETSSPLAICANFIHGATMDNKTPWELASELCRVNCSQFDRFSDGWVRFCSNIVAGLRNFPYTFFCNGTESIQSLPFKQVCDGQTDCSNGADEFGCPLPERFHCDPNVTAEWVHVDKVCDSVKDCSNGADECGTCQFENLSSPEFLIQSKIIAAVTSIMGAVIISLNVKEGYKCWKMDCSSKNKAIDRIFLLQIFLYDGLMGVYLCSIVLAAVILKVKGDYCVIEQDWRASTFCPALGVIFSLSSHGSLLTIASVSITRFLACQSFVAEIRKKAVIEVSFICACLNFFHSIMPLLPVPAIQNTFRSAIFMKNLNENPFVSSNPVNLSRLTEVYTRMFNKNEEHDINVMSRKLNNITSRPNIFDFIEIGYYGNTGFCVHNIFKDNGDQYTYRIYKIIYCSVLFALLSVVSFAYVKIVLKQRRSNRAAANTAGPNSTAVTALTLKVVLMIGSQLVCWISFITTVLYFQYMTKKPATPMTFEIFALVVIPINSFLNPVFYSELYKKLIRSLNFERKKLSDLWLLNFWARELPSAHPANLTEFQLAIRSEADLPTDNSFKQNNEPVAVQH
ncbi:hypothetical protein ACHWQZ_G005004 [Mnemiopsis leidyi]